jgi:glycosyltransferase involved in cell wall biosynthesis
MSNTNPIKGLVSIGVPTFNRADALDNILNILLQQTYRRLEIIISDNASIDNKVIKTI